MWARWAVARGTSTNQIAGRTQGARRAGASVGFMRGPAAGPYRDADRGAHTNGHSNRPRDEGDPRALARAPTRQPRRGLDSLPGAIAAESGDPTVAEGGQRGVKAADDVRLVGHDHRADRAIDQCRTEPARPRLGGAEGFVGAVEPLVVGEPGPAETPVVLRGADEIEL